MIDLYTWATPNGRKVSIALEEMGLAYTAHAIDIMADEQFAPEFLAISPNNKIPAIRDHDTGLALMESGAILMYLAEKTGQFWPQQFETRWRVTEWLMWQMGGVGPFLGQLHHFVAFNKGISDYAEQRYLREGRRLYGVLDARLAQHEFVAGDYSIADMAIWPWIARFEIQTIEMSEFPNVLRWYMAVAARPAVERGYRVPDAGAHVPIPAPLTQHEDRAP